MTVAVPSSWTLRQRFKNDLFVSLARGFLTGLRVLPPAAYRILGRALGLVAYVIAPTARRRALSNASRVMSDWPPQEQRRLIRRSYIELGGYLGDTLALLNHPERFAPLTLTDEGQAQLAEACDEGRGVVLPSAHLGPWEHLAATLTFRGFDLTVVTRASYDPRLDAIYTQLRRGAGVSAIARGTPGAEFQLVRTLRNGGILGIPMDLRSRVPSIVTTFLGLPAPTAVGPARIALRTGAAVVVATIAPTCNDQIEITTTRISTLHLGADAAGEMTLTSRINDELSRRIRALPHAWVWMHSRFE